MNTFKELIQMRESCRNFNEKELEFEKLEEIAFMARLSPSAMNSQPWSIHIIHSKEIVNQINSCFEHAIMNRFASKAKAFMVLVEEPKSLLTKIGEKIKDQDYHNIDIGILASHIILGAASLNIASCMLGWFPEKELFGLLELHKNQKIRLLIALGYSNITPREKRRKPIEKIVKYY